MLIVVSPSKTQDFDTSPAHKDFTIPQQLPDSSLLVKQLKQFKASEIGELMKISDKLAELNRDRFNAWRTPFNPKNAKQAVFAFKGDVYSGLDIDSFNKTQLSYCQAHLRILSGLYGLLKPLDLIQPYRLEMGTRLVNERGNNLYAFWDRRITDKLNADLEEQGAEYLVNLASNEYFKSVKVKQLARPLITPQFKEYKNGDYKMIGVYAKRARGLMSQYILKNRIENARDLQSFDVEGYAFNPRLSQANDWVFTRKQ